MATAVSLTAEQANKVDLAVTKVIGSIRQNIDDLGGWMKAALFDGVATDLRKSGFDDDVADLANDLADAIREQLREGAEKPLGRESASWRGDVA
jgi:hypothetical protein